MTIEEQVEVDAPPDRVWKLIRNPVGLTRLDGGLTVEPDAATSRAGLRARYRVLLHVGAVPIGSDVEIVDHQPFRELAWTSLTGVDHRFRIRLRGLGPDRTRVILRFGYSSPGPLGLLADVVSYGRVRAIMRRLVAAIKAEAERPAGRGRRRGSV
jgi:uncharacterized membrane protein